METPWCNDKSNYKSVNECLKTSLPQSSELNSLINSSDPNIKILSTAYFELLNSKLYDFRSLEYQEKKITNLMVISARGYLPILDNKRTEVTKVILDSQDINGLTALHYAINGNNTSIVYELINLGADLYLKNNVNESSLDLIQRRALVNSIYKDLLSQINSFFPPSSSFFPPSSSLILSPSSEEGELPLSIIKNDISDIIIKGIYPSDEIHHQFLDNIVNDYIIEHTKTDKMIKLTMESLLKRRKYASLKQKFTGASSKDVPMLLDLINSMAKTSPWKFLNVWGGMIWFMMEYLIKL